MPNRRLPTHRAGQGLTPRDLNVVNREGERLGRFTVGPGLNLQISSAGFHLSLTVESPFYIKILTGGSGSSYPWQEVTRQGGTWISGPRSGTLAANPAIEENGNTAVVVNSIVEAYRYAGTGEILFGADQC